MNLGVFGLGSDHEKFKHDLTLLIALLTVVLRLSHDTLGFGKLALNPSTAPLTLSIPLLTLDLISSHFLGASVLIVFHTVKQD